MEFWLFRQPYVNEFSFYSRVLNTRAAYDKFPDFFRMGTFIDSKHMKL